MLVNGISVALYSGYTWIGYDFVAKCNMLNWLPRYGLISVNIGLYNIYHHINNKTSKSVILYCTNVYLMPHGIELSSRIIT